MEEFGNFPLKMENLPFFESDILSSEEEDLQYYQNLFNDYSKRGEMAYLYQIEEEWKELREEYKEPLRKPMSFYFLSTCGCNMGHCNAVTDYQLMKVKTLGGLFRILGHVAEDIWCGHRRETMGRPYLFTHSPYVGLNSCITETPEKIKIHYNGCREPATEVTMGKQAKYIASYC